MALSWKAGCWLAVLSLICLPAPTAQAHGDWLRPLRWPGDIGNWLSHTCPPDVYTQNLAPWYTYFPSDPAMSFPAAGPVYPTWPSSFTPPPISSGPQIYMPTSIPGQNSNMSIPSYWFAR
jgi:hypothetical protein